MPGTENITPDALPAVKAPKLRSSCEGCGNAKVKCDRGQPKCSRCATLQLTCVYGISLKHGKPPRKRPISCLDTQNSPPPKKRAGSATRTVQSAENHMTMGLEQSLDINKPPRPVPMIDTPLSSSLGSTEIIQRHDENSAIGARQSQTCNAAGPLKSPDLATGNLPAASNINASSSMHGPNQHGSNFFNPFTIDEWPQFDIWGTGPEFPPTSNDTRLSASGLEPLNNHSASFDSPEVHSCPRGSYELFRDLICPSPFLHAPEANVDTVSARLDEVLHFNSQAIDRLRQLLKCPCAKSGHRIMVHASIISRILIWYQQAAGWTNISAWESRPAATAASPSLDNASSSSSSPSSGAATDNETANPPTLVQSTGFAVAQVPVSMGTFNVEDENMQDIFRNQLVLSELKKAANVIDLFASQQPGECSATGVASLYSHLGVWLRSEHLRTAGMLKARLSALNKTLDC
ncbi:hypothetical protein L207DRAFT_568919 [Hyaloscypha variabilis F]|uniref:Zn(2)-C6 fungal-type domain-containing protein n=1 Tax=Hyaloscypha variabilis (strain UAMH 11265 / GT02V1 / F) TaxID=1149755 RepID=A0A2J6RDW4_HYAVF|nr:hypothetical protein L207DRAFT_568919 [Hyaloscypha variabilis F]